MKKIFKITVSMLVGISVGLTFFLLNLGTLLPSVFVTVTFIPSTYFVLEQPELIYGKEYPRTKALWAGFGAGFLLWNAFGIYSLDISSLISSSGVAVLIFGALCGMWAFGMKFASLSDCDR